MLLLARIVTLSTPAVLGTHVTTPVVASMRKPSGPSTSDHVIGGSPPARAAPSSSYGYGRSTAARPLALRSMTGAEPANDGSTATMNVCSVAPNGFSARMTTSVSPGCSGVHVTRPVLESISNPAG